MPAASPKSLVKACRRLNPAVALDVDVVAVQRAAVCSTKSEWSAGTLTTAQVDDAGAVRLSESGSLTLFQSPGTSAGATDAYHLLFPANTNGGERLWLDFWPDPSLIGASGFTLHSLDLVLGRRNGTAVFGGPLTNAGQGKVLIEVARLDSNWNREALGSPLILDATALAMDGGLLSINFRSADRTITIRTGRLRTRTGSGFDGTNERAVDFVFEGDKKVSRLEVAMGFSVGISVVGANRQGFFVGMVPTATSAQFDTSTFWRHSGGSEARDTGPYSPDANGPTALANANNPGYGYLSTGAVPSYGAKNTAALTAGTPNGTWGVSREVGVSGKPQTGSGDEPHAWQQPWHVLRGVSYHTSGTALVVLDLGAVPVNEVHFRADTAEPTSTAVTFSLRGRNLLTDAWTSIGAVADGAILPSAQRFRYYEVTATLTGSSDGLVSPILQAVSVTERIRFATFPYMASVDSTANIDPVTAQSEIGELKLPLLKAGRKDFRDIVTSIASDYSAQSVEAWVYARETITGTRHFLNLYRLEDRDPSLGEEDLTFVSGLDRLKVTVPPKVTTFTYPADGTDGVISSRTYNSTTKELTITVSGTPFSALNVAGMRYEGISGTLAGSNWYVVSSPAPTDHTFTIVLEHDSQEPAAGDHFKLHSDKTTRDEVAYAGADFAAVYADVLANQAAVPQRLRGALPATTGRTTDGRLEADGREATPVIEELALHCGGAPAWIKGRISFVDLYGDKDVVETWNERDIVTLKTPTGYNRRMPSVGVKYGYDFAAGSFGFEASYDDRDALLALGRANLFDVVQLSDDLCKWNTDVNEAQFVTLMLLKAWSTGVRLWPATVNTPRPWLEYGDAVAVSTDEYTDRRPAFAPDGVSDIGTPIRGRVSAVGVIVGKNLLGTEFLLAVRGLGAITATPASGTIEVPNNEPTIDVQVSPGATSYTFTFTSNGTVEYRVDSGAWTAATSPLTVSRTAAGGADRVVILRSTLGGKITTNGGVTVPSQLSSPSTTPDISDVDAFVFDYDTNTISVGWSYSGLPASGYMVVERSYDSGSYAVASGHLVTGGYYDGVLQNLVDDPGGTTSVAATYAYRVKMYDSGGTLVFTSSVYTLNTREGF